MVQVSVAGQQYYMDGVLQQNLDLAKKTIRKDMDFPFLIDGRERSGKSVFAMQIAKYCDPTFDMSRVCFTPGEFKRAVLKAEKYQAVVYDEAYTGLSSRGTMSLINKTLIGLLAEIGQKNLFVIVVMPTFFDLDKYAALWRSQGLFHVYMGDNFERGFFKFFGYEKKLRLYIDGKKTYNYRSVRPDFSGRFTNHYVLDEAEYREKKRKSLMARDKGREAEEGNRQAKEDLLLRLVEAGHGISVKDKARLLGVTEQTYWWKVRRLKGEVAENAEEKEES